jgi:DNA polymerase I-like protein with 3'-5' exonuclease and polymerase domains
MFLKKLNRNCHWKFRKYHISSLQELDEKIHLIKEKGIVSFHTKLSIKEIHENVMIGVSFTVEDDTFYVPIIRENVDFLNSVDLFQQHEFYPKMKQIFEDENIKKISHDAKHHLKNLNRYNIESLNSLF